MLSDYQRYRMYEMLPGLSIWGTFFIILLLSFLKPLWMIYVVILFDIYWVLKVLNFSFYLIIASYRFFRVKQIDWQDALVHEVVDYDKKMHVVFLTVYNEDWDIVKSAIQSVCDAAYDPQKFVIVIAGEERTHAHCDMMFEHIRTHFSTCFFEILYTLHPMNLPDEIPGKGSNVHFAEQQLKTYIDKKTWDYADVIATIFDIDTICHPQYFAYLTYVYCNHPRPTRSSFQPVSLYNNNMWESPAMLRIMAFGTTFWLMTSLARQDALVTFSSHSMSFQAIVDAGFHDKRIVSEDSRIFYQAFLAYDGDYEVTPLYIPVSMDTVRDDKWWVSLKNLYKQQRRWAWGTEHIPYLLWEFRKKGRRIPRWKKWKWLFVEWEGKWSWALAALIITIMGRLPLWMAGPDVRQSALFFNAPHLLQTLMTMALLGLFLSAIFSLPLLPKKPSSHARHVYIIMFLQWTLLPITMILVSAIPAIDAVTRLMLGKYLGFNVSQKKRGS